MCALLAAMLSPPLIPAQAGIQDSFFDWVPAFAGTSGMQCRFYFFFGFGLSRSPSVRRRSALSLMKPSASCWL